jgi:hypothetical protein
MVDFNHRRCPLQITVAEAPSIASEASISADRDDCGGLLCSNGNESLTAFVSGAASTSVEPLTMGNVFSAAANACAAGLFR